MSVYTLQPADYNQVVALWNKSVFNKEVLHKQLRKGAFIEKFITDTPELKKLNYVYKKEGKCIGFANACYKTSEKIAYITYVLVDKKNRRRGIGHKLFKAVEDTLIKNTQIERIDIMFMNPINLEWGVPYTTGHTHPNAPGVDIASEAYIFFKNRGYQDVVAQHAYYRELKEFKYTEEIEERERQLRERGLTISYYDSERHHGLEALFDDLNNSLWKEAVMNNIEKKDSLPLLIVEDHGKVCGFTGPLIVEANKRGYFAGIGVHSAYRSYGIGKVLFLVLCRSLKEQGAEYMTLFTGENNPARYIYESAGFRVVRTWQTMRKKIR